MINHHPSKEQLVDFTSGSMQTHYAVAVSAHLEFCEQCRVNARKIESIGTIIFEKIEPVEVSATVKDKLLSQLDQQTPNILISDIHPLLNI